MYKIVFKFFEGESDNVKRLVEGIRRMKIITPLCVLGGLCGSYLLITEKDFKQVLRSIYALFKILAG
jgi:hypothetical protein